MPATTAAVIAITTQIKADIKTSEAQIAAKEREVSWKAKRGEDVMGCMAEMNLMNDKLLKQEAALLYHETYGYILFDALYAKVAALEASVAKLASASSGSGGSGTGSGGTTGG